MHDKRNTSSMQREWSKKFGSFAMKSVKGAVLDLTPNISTSASSIADMSREGREFISKTKSAVIDQTKSLDRNNIGRSARNILESAFKDMDNDDYSYDKFSDDSYGEMNDLLGDLDAGIDEDDPELLAKQETRKNTAVIGKVIASGNNASLTGMKRMTRSISSSVIKSSNASTAKLTNVALFGINKINADLTIIHKDLAVANANLTAIVKFQNQNVNEMNRSTLEYYDKSLTIMNKMGENIAMISDQMTKMQETRNPRNRKDSFSFFNGFDFYGYKDHVKKNFDGSMLGMALGMGKMAGGMMGGAGGIADEIGKGIVKALIPKKLKKSSETMDKNVNRTLNNLLYSLGDWGSDYGGDPIKQMIGELLGKERPRFTKNPNLAGFKKGAMSWNGEAQKTLVEVIPGYLARIEKALTGKDAQYYDMDKGMFKSEKTIQKQFMTDYNSKREMGMSESVDSLVKALKESGVGDKDQKQTMQMMNALLNDRLMDTKDNKAFRTGAKDILSKSGMSNSQVSKVIFDMEDNIVSTFERMNEMMENMSDVYRTQFNQFEKNRSNLFTNTDFFGKTSSLGMTSFMSDDERKRYEKEKIQKEKKEKYESSMKSTIHSKIKTWTDGKDGRFSKKISKLGDHFFGDPTKKSIKPETFFSKLEKYSVKKIDDLNVVLLDIDELVSTGKISPYSAKEMKSAVMQKINNATNTNSNDIRFGSRFEHDKSRPERASSRLNSNTSRASSDMQRIASRTNFSFKASLKAKPGELDSRDLDKASVKLNNEAQNISGKSGASSRLSMKQNADPATVAAATNTGLLLTIQKKFLAPMVGGLFGEKGFFKSITNKENINKITKTLKEKLFDEKEGVFNEFTKGFKDSVDYMKYVFTGKGYTTRRGGKSIPDSKNSVVGHMKDAYDFVFSNTMKYFFGDDYKNADGFKKYFKWMDIKGKKKKEVSPENTAEAEVADKVFGEAKTSKNPKTGKVIPFPVQGQLTSDVAEASAKVAEKIESRGEEFVEKNFNPTEKEQEKVHNKVNKNVFSKFKKILPKSIAAAGIGGALAMATGLGGAGLLGAMVLPTTFMGGAIAAGGLTLMSKSETFNKFLFGDVDKDGKRIGGIFSSKMQQSMKKALPFIVGGGVLGALKNVLFSGATSAMGAGGGGLLLSTLLPGGPIGGALMGMGLGLLKNNEKFNKILFGTKGEDGKSFGGIFSKSKNFMSKVYMGTFKFMKGGAKGLAAGAVTGATLSQFGLLGGAMSMGGPVGMGLMGLGLGIAGTAKKFNQFLFGTQEYDEDGNPKRKIRNGILDKVRNMLVLNMVEPIKFGIQNEMTKFAYWAKEKIEYPFRLAFGPILDSLKGIKANVTDYFKAKFDKFTDGIADFMKGTIKKIFSPFTTIVGKIGKGLLTAVRIGTQMSLSPLTGALKMAQIATMPKRAKEKLPMMMKVLKNGGGELVNKWGEDDSYNKNRGKISKVRSNVLKDHDIENLSDNDKVSIRERLAKAGVGGNQISTDESLLSFLKDQGQWEEGHSLKADTGLFRGLRKIKNRFGDIKSGYNSATEGFIEGLEDTGVKNAYNWMRVGREKKDLSTKKKKDFDFLDNRTAINKLSRKYAKQDGYGEANWNEAQLKSMQKKFGKHGIKKEWMGTNADMYDLIYNFDDWKDKFGIAKGSGSEYYSGKNAPGGKMPFFETEEQRSARIKTTDYQDQVLAEFEGMRKMFYKMGFDQGEDNKIKKSEKLSQKEIKRMKDTLKRRGMKIEDLGMSEEDLVDMGSLPGWAIDLYRDSDEYGTGDFKKWYSTNMKEDKSGQAKVKVGDNPDENASEKAIILDMYKETKKQTKIAADAANIASGGLYDQQKAVNGKENFSDKEASETTYTEQDKEKDEAESNEKTAKINALTSARGLAQRIKNKLFGGTGSTDETEGGEDNEVTEEETPKGKAISFVSSFGGWVEKGIGGIFSKMSETGWWGALGLGTVIAGLWGDKIMSVAGPILKPMWDSATEFARTHIGPAMLTVGKTIQQYAPLMANNIATMIGYTAPTLIKTYATVMSTLVTTALKMAVNTVASSVGLPKPFKFAVDNMSLDTKSMTTTTEGSTSDGKSKVYKDAISNKYARDTNQGKAKVLKNGTYVDEDGNEQSVATKSGWHTNYVHDAVNIARDTFGTRGALKSTAKFLGGSAIKTSAKVLSHMVPGGRLAYGAASKVGKLMTQSAEEKAAKKASEGAVKDAAERKAKNALLRKLEGPKAKMVKWVNTAIEAALKVAKNSKFAKYSKPIIEAFSQMKGKILEFVMKSDDNIISKLLKNIAEKTAKGSAKTAVDAIPIAGWIIQGGFTLYDLTTGALDASSLFEIDDDDVTAGMRVVSSLMKGILGIGPAFIIDILMEVYSALSGHNAKKWLATTLYSHIPFNDGGAKNLKQAQSNYEKEVSNYNKANGTNLSSTAYTNLKNKKTKTSWYKKVGNFFTGKKSKKEDFSKYEVNDTTASTAIGNGNGAVGYGNSQADSRWANYKIGKFSNGQASTMATGGCGPTALANITGQSPLGIAKLAKDNGYISDGGANARLFTDGAASMGLSGKKINSKSLKSELASGKPVIIAGKSVGKGIGYGSDGTPYTRAGHIISATGIDKKTGKVIVQDPMHGGTELKSIDSLTKGMTDGWSYNTKSIGNGSGPVGYGFFSKVGKFLNNAVDGVDKAVTSAQNWVNSSGADMGKSIENFVVKAAQTGSWLSLPGGAQVLGAKALYDYNKKETKKRKDAKSKNVQSNATSSTNTDPDTMWTIGNTGISGGGIGFQNPSFYVGHSVKDLKDVLSKHPELLKKSQYRLFKEVYNFYVKLKKRGNTYVIKDESAINALNEVVTIQSKLGKTGKLSNNYEFKNGFPFFRNSDKRWKDTKWKGKTIGSRGSDISSLAMIASAFGNNIIPPNYIYNQWLQDNKSWWSKSGGLNESEVFKDGSGFNSLSSTFKNSKPLRITKAQNMATVMAALKSRKPVYMTGYKFGNSVFGGSGDPSKVDTESLDSRNSLVATYGSNNALAVNDPTTGLQDNSVFALDYLNRKIEGSPTGHAYESAYIISDGENKGLKKNVSMKSKTKPKSSFVSIKGKTGIDAIAAIGSNFVNMANNLISAGLNGTGYKSLFSSKISGEKKISSAKVKQIHKELNKKIKKDNKAKADGTYLVMSTGGGIQGSYGTKAEAEEAAAKSGGMVQKVGNSVKKPTAPKKSSVKSTNTATVNSGSAISASSSKNGSGGGGRPLGGGDMALGFGKKKSKLPKNFKTGDFSSVTGNSEVEKIANKIGIIANAAMGTKAGMSYTAARDGLIKGNSGSSTDSSGSDTGSITSNSSIKGSALKKKIWDFFTGLGYSEEATAGIMGNIQQENGMWDPGRHQVGGPAAGLFQWENANDSKTGRWANLNHYAQQKGTTWDNWEAQAKFADLELGSSVAGYFKNAKTVNDIDGKSYSVPATTYAKWKNSSDVGTAAMQFEAAFERAGKPNMKNRISSAKRFYELYASSNKGIGYGQALLNYALGFGDKTYKNGITAEDVITVANSQIGYLEKASNNNLDDFTSNVGENNYTKYGKWYGINGQPWCAMFVSWCFTQAANGNKNNAAKALCGSLYAQCSAGAAKFKEAKQWIDGSQSPEPGDIIFFAKTRGGHEYHTGIVIGVNGTTITTIEGNTSSGSLGTVEENGGCCAKKKYTVGASAITGYGRPRYDGTSAFSGDCGSTLSDASSTTTATTSGTSDSTSMSNPFTAKLNNIISSMNSTGTSKSSDKLGNGVGEYFENTLGGSLASGYGKRGSNYHRGLDIRAGLGRDIRTPISGTVTDNGNDPKGFGNYVAIKDRNGMNHIFGHMNSKSKLPVGYGVVADSVIGEVGSTGNSTGSHLHYEVRKASDKYSSIDPSRVKYNNARGSLNINDTTFGSNEGYGIGSGSKDIKTSSNDTIIKKLDVAVKTEGVENKLDVLIDVMRDWAGREKHPTTIVHKQDKSVGKGTGSSKAKKSASPKKNRNSNDTTEDRRLFSIHESIALK